LSRLGSHIGMKLGLQEWYRTDVFITSVLNNAKLQSWFAVDYNGDPTGDEIPGAKRVAGGSEQQLPRVFEDM
jgi:hypothetical protein